MRMAILAMAAALGACGETSSDGDDNSRAIRVTSDYETRLANLSELNRGLALKRAIQDSGAACKKVDASNHQQAYRNMSMWVARCSDSGEWALFIAPNGDVQARKCADAAQLSLPGCRFEGAEKPPTS